MSPPIIAEGVGEISHLPDALERHSNDSVVLYCRVSEASQVRNGSLDRQRAEEIQAHRSMPLRLKGIVSGQEYGKLSADRPHFQQALEMARRHNAILSCSDLSRLIRPEAFDRRTNWDAIPTQDEKRRLLEIANGVPLATRKKPGLTAAQIHSEVTKRGEPGRKSIFQINPKLVLKILESHEEEISLRNIAKQLGITKGMVQRVLDSPAVNGYCWKELEYPSKAFKQQFGPKR